MYGNDGDDGEVLTIHICGPSNSGKTTIPMQFVTGGNYWVHNPERTNTVFWEPKKTTIFVEGRKQTVGFFDGNSEHHREEGGRRKYSRTCLSKSGQKTWPEVILLCARLDDPGSLERVVRLWAPALAIEAPGVPWILVGTAADLANWHVKAEGKALPFSKVESSGVEQWHLCAEEGARWDATATRLGAVRFIPSTVKIGEVNRLIKTATKWAVMERERRDHPKREARHAAAVSKLLTPNLPVAAVVMLILHYAIDPRIDSVSANKGSLSRIQGTSLANAFAAVCLPKV